MNSKNGQGLSHKEIARCSKPQAIVRFTKKLLETPLLRENLKQDPILKSLSVIRQSNATNYKVTPQEWQRVEQWKD